MNLRGVLGSDGWCHQRTLETNFWFAPSSNVLGQHLRSCLLGHSSHLVLGGDAAVWVAMAGVINGPWNYFLVRSFIGCAGAVFGSKELWCSRCRLHPLG
jgi:hypothetical protein